MLGLAFGIMRLFDLDNIDLVSGGSTGGAPAPPPKRG